MVGSRTSARIVGLLLLAGAALVTLGSCRGVFGRNTGPIDAFAFLPDSNAGLSEPVQGFINNRPDPKEISLVVPPGTDLSRLVATITLNTEAAITVISTGRRVPQTSLTPNNFSVPVTYAIELPGEDEPILYTVRVREASTNARLIELSVADSNYQRPTFGPNVTSYQAEVPFATSSVQVTARAEDPNAFAISVNGVRAGTGQATAPVDFSVGDSVNVVVEVVAEDKNTRQEYAITVVRGEPDRNSDLAALRIEGVELDQVFRVDRPSYTATIPYSARELTFSAQAESRFSTIDIAGIPVAGGAATIMLDEIDKQAITIEVTAQDGSSTVYQVSLTRAEPNRNTALAAITADAGEFSPVFDPNVDRYVVTLADSQTRVGLNARAESNLSIAEANTDSTGVQLASRGPGAQAAVTLGEGESKVVVFTVTAESGETRDYRVVVRRDLGFASVVFSDLSLFGAELSPAFAPDVTEYTVNVPVDTESVRVIGTTFDPSIQVAVRDKTHFDQPAEFDLLAFEGLTVKTPVTLTAPNGIERTYTFAVTRPAPQSRIGRRILEVSMAGLRLPRREAASLSNLRLATDARIRVRYHREPEVIFEDFARLSTEQSASNVQLSLNYRSDFIDLDLSRYIDLEVSVAVSDGRFLTYNTVLFADGNLDVRPGFMFIDDRAEMEWPEPGTPRPITARVRYQLADAARNDVASLGDEFVTNAEGEFETRLEIINLESGVVLGTETLPTKPGSIHGRGIPSVEGIELPEDSQIGYVLTAWTRDGRLVRDHGAVAVRTVETFDNGEWEFATVYIEAELDLVK